MSFILDALKKSESDRQRQSGPALFEVKVAPPRSRLPLWAIAIAALLAVNLVIVAWMMLRRPAAHEESALTAPAATPAAPASASAAPITPAPPAPAQVPASAPTAPGAAAPATALAAPGGAAPATPLTPPAAAGGNATEESAAEDLAPAADPAPVPALSSHVRRGTADGVPLYQDWAAMPGTHVPPLRLDLHVYAQRPEERFVMINMKKMHEGDALPEGVRVESITPEGAVLSYNGSHFLLPRD